MSQHIIDKLGGNKAVADALGIKANVVANWRLADRQIPWRHRPALARLAVERAVSLPEDFWEGAAA
jgi:DNA-binding transcriptional regulator YdaS (Cro superfamily)